MNNLRFNKVKSHTPITVIVHGGNRLGSLLTKILIEQGGYVVLIDKFDNTTKKYISDLKKSELVDFFDFKGFDSLFDNIKRIDYLYYLLDDKLAQGNFESKEFLSETKYLETSLNQTKKNEAKFSLVTSLQLNRELVERTDGSKISVPAPYSNIELQKYCETMVAEYKDKTNINARIIRLGTLIGKGQTRLKDEALHSLFKDATDSPQITIKGEGLDIHNLIHEDDATYGILKLTFANNTKGEVITLANKNDYTTLSVAYKLLELNTDAQSIKFIDNPDDKFVIKDIYVPAPHASKYGWTQQISLEKGIIDQIQVYYDNINKSWDITKEPTKTSTKILTKESKTELGEFFDKLKEPFRKAKEEREKKRSAAKPNPKAIAGWAIGLIILLLLTYFLIYPIIGTTIGIYTASRAIKNIPESFLSAQIDESKEEIEQAKQSLNRASNSFDNLFWLFKLTNNERTYDNASKLFVAGTDIASGAGQLIDAAHPLAMYIKDFKPAISLQETTATTSREYREYLNMIDENKYKLEDAEYKISLASELLKTVETNSFPPFMRESVIQIKELANTAQIATNTYKETTYFIPKILGVDERQRYLILLQNESEIRSTGGWITSYGIVGIEGGQIRELFVDDIYNADGTLRVQGKKYNPPASMASVLEIKDWTFSLVNWSPNLQEVLTASQQFVDDLEKGNDIDGIITIDITFFQKLLGKWGGIEVPGEDELITADNIQEKVYQMHREFTPGSTQKTTFLANLANEIVKKFLSMDINQIIEMGDILTSSLNEKHLQVAMRNSQAQNFFNSRDWGGTLSQKYNDAPIVIDWNWGGNKANQYLNKNHSLAVTVKDQDHIDFAYTLTVENTSTSNTYPQGDYTNYQRVYIPSEAEILRIVGMKENKYDTYKESGYKVIGGWFNIPVKGISTLEISYRLEREKVGSNFPILQQESALFLDLNIFKQAGERKHAYKLDISYPSSWSLRKAEGLNTISNQLSTRFDLNKDTEYQIVWDIPN